MITIDRLTKKFGRFAAVSELSLDIRPGESVALWGPNGAGKSTIIRCVLGLYRFRGGISVAGFDVRRRGKHARRAIGYVPQELGFYDELRVREAIRHFGRLKGVGSIDAGALLGRVGLDGNESKRIRELSGGMKQRLALGLALIGDPPVLVLDEVTASLDAMGRGEFVRLLATLGQEGRTMLFASHRQEEVRALASRVVLLERGRVVREYTPAELFGVAPDVCELRLHMDRERAALALGVLRERGLSARLNCVGVIVSVDGGANAAPMHVLGEAGIRFDNFDFTPPAAARGTEVLHG